jgi:hypothetical protein
MKLILARFIKYDAVQLGTQQDVHCSPIQDSTITLQVKRNTAYSNQHTDRHQTIPLNAPSYLSASESVCYSCRVLGRY